MKASKLPACVGLPRRPPAPVRLTPGGSSPATSAEWDGSVPPMNSKLKCTVSPTWSVGTASVMFVRVPQSPKAGATQRRTRARTTGTLFMSLSFRYVFHPSTILTPPEAVSARLLVLFGPCGPCSPLCPCLEPVKAAITPGGNLNDLPLPRRHLLEQIELDRDGVARQGAAPGA